MKWLILLCFFLHGIAYAVDSTTSTTSLPKISDDVPGCRTPEGKEYKKGQTGYRACIKRKQYNREEKKMPDFDNANTNMQMRN